MIEEATIECAPDGGILIVIPPSGMDKQAQTFVSVVDGFLCVGQNGVWFVKAQLASPADADLVIGNADIAVGEFDAQGWEFHSNVKES